MFQWPLLRALEEEGFVRSEWHAELPARPSGVYELTHEGQALLGAWAEALRRAREEMGAFLERYGERR